MDIQSSSADPSSLTRDRELRASAISRAGNFQAALRTGEIPNEADITLSEAIVLGLLNQGVRKFVVVFGHGSTEIGEVLRIYQAAGVLNVYPVRSEIEASHAATALRWITEEKAAVVTSIGPGALQALAASLVPHSNGIGVWYILGDETTEDEGPNFQQIPSDQQAGFLKLYSQMANTYTLHTPLAISTALRRGLNITNHPVRPGPFFLLCPMNTQPILLRGYNLNEIPSGSPPPLGAASEGVDYDLAAKTILEAERVVVRLGGGARKLGSELLDFLDLSDGVAITAPVVSGVLPYQHPRNMTVAGSKGSISGNFAMENADLLVAIGTRFVCQSDCSRTGYLQVKNVININGDVGAAMHYNRTHALIGDASATLGRLVQALRERQPSLQHPSLWLKSCQEKKREWVQYKMDRYQTPSLYDETWGRPILTQPAAIKIAVDWARENNVISLFDAGDVQAHGFQIVEDERLGQSFTDGGASYMGFGVSALLATALSTKPITAMAITGDGSFMMNPQILIDGIEHHARGIILLLDNRRMSAISALQRAQYGKDFATNDSVEVDYAAMARSIKGIHALYGGDSPSDLLAALEESKDFNGLSVIHVPVYYGEHSLGALGAFGRWNVGNWSQSTQTLRHQIGL